MARPLEVRELIPELQFWIKSPTDPSLRKLLRKTIQTLEAFKDLVGEPEPSGPSPTLQDRIDDSIS
jgi:hypothetical protein